MAASTLTDPEHDQNKYNPGQEDYAQKFERDFGSRPTLNEDPNATGQDAIDQAKERLQRNEQDAATPNGKQAGTDLQNREAQPPNFYKGGGGAGGRTNNYAKRIAKRWAIGIGTSIVTGVVTATIAGVLGLFVNMKEMAFDFFTKNHYSSYSKRTKSLQKRIFNVPQQDCNSIRCRLHQGVSDKEIDKYQKAGLRPEVGEANGKKYIISFTTTDTNGRSVRVTGDNFKSVYESNLRFRSNVWVVSKPKAMVWRAQHAVKKFSTFHIARNKLVSKAKEFRKYVYGGGQKEVRVKPDSDAQSEQTEAARQIGELDETITQQGENVRAELEASDYEKPATSILPDPSNLDTDDGIKAAGVGIVEGGLRGAAFGAFNFIDRACAGYQVLRTVVIGSKILAYSALILYAMSFMTHADALKAGDISPEQIAFIAGILVTPSVLAGSKGKTVANSNFFSLITQNKVSSKSGLGFATIGAPVFKAFQYAKKAFEQLGANRNTCQHVQRWYGQLTLGILGITTSIITGGGGLVGGIITGLAIGAILGVIVAYALPLLIQFIAGTAAPDPEHPGGGYVAGEAIAAGLGGFASELGKGGLRPLGSNEAQAVMQQTNQEMAKIKAIDRIGKSPFSLDSPDSIPSRLAMATAPYLSAPTTQTTFQNLTTLAMSPLNIVGNAVNQLFTKRVGALSTNYGGEYCADDDLREMGVLTDAYCNPVYGELEETIDAPQYDPELVVNYMLDNNHVNEDGSVKSDDFQKFIDSCVDGTTPIMPDGGGADVTDSSVDTRWCVRTDQRETMFRMYVFDNNILGGMDASAEGTLGAPAASQASTTTGSLLSVEACEGAIPAGDTIKILCESLKYDNYGYLWGGGHSGTAEQFVRRFNSGVYTPGRSNILDCSGLVRMAVYEAFGTDIGGGNVASTMPLTQYFQRIPIEEAKPGDFFARDDLEHVGIIWGNNTADRTLEIFHASTDGVEFSRQIRYDPALSYDGNHAYRYIGPKND
jgi:hypothetical protein